MTERMLKKEERVKSVHVWKEIKKESEKNL